MPCFVNINDVLGAGIFDDDYSTISLEAPEISEKFVHLLFVHVDESLVVKSSALLLAKVQRNIVPYFP